MTTSGTEFARRQVDFRLALRCVRSLEPLGLTAQEQTELEAVQLRRIAVMAPGLAAMTIVSVLVPPMIFYGINGIDGLVPTLPWMALVTLGALALCAFIWPMRHLSRATPAPVLARKRHQLHFVATAALFCVGLVVALAKPVSTGSSQEVFLLVYVTFIGMAALACTAIASFSNPLISAGALMGLITPYVAASILNVPSYAPFIVAFLLIYILCFWLLGLNAFQNFLQLEVNSLDRRRQRDVITLLLGEIEAQSSDWLWETDANGYLTHVPEQMQRASDGIARVGVRLSDLATGADDPAWQTLKRAIQQAEPFRKHDVTVEATDHTRHWRLSGTPRQEEQGGYRGVGSDMTSEVMAKQAREEADLLVRSIVESSPTTFSCVTCQRWQSDLSTTPITRPFWRYQNDAGIFPRSC